MVQSQSTPREHGRAAPFAVLWDLDGVLVDTSKYHFAAWRWLMADFGKHLSEAEFRRTFGLRDSEILPRLLPSLSAEEVERLSERKEAYFRRLLAERIPLLPGVERLVNDLAAVGVPQAVASSTPRANLEMILPGLHLPLSVYVAAEDVVEGKPAPEVLLKAAERLAVPPSRCVAVEDAVAGVEAACRAGMAVLAVATTWPPERLSRADLVVESLEEVSVDTLAGLAADRTRAGWQGGRH